MKKLKFLMIAMVAVFAASCDVDDVENRPVVTGGDAPVLTAPEEGNLYTLNGDNIDGLAERFIWTPANFGDGIIVNYTVEIDSLGHNFDSPVILGATVGTTQFAASNGILNDAILALGGVPEQPGSYEARIRASVGDMVLYSNIVEMLITPYQGVVPVKHYYVVGTATEYGYDNNNNNMPLFRDAANQDLFVLTAYFAMGELKLLENLGSWQPQYGTNDNLTLAGSENGDPGAILVPAAGYYTFTVNFADMTYSLEQFDASSAPVYTTIGITGSATPEGWPDNGVQDVNMVNPTTNPHIWKVDNITLSENAAKFRAEDDWATNWGGGTAPAGTATLGGQDIPVPTAGTYDVWFNDLDGRYIFIPQL